MHLQRNTEFDDEHQDTQESSGSIGSRIDDLEDTLEQKLRLKSGTSRFMRCIGGLLKVLIKWYMWLQNKDHEE